MNDNATSLENLASKFGFILAFTGKWFVFYGWKGLKKSSHLSPFIMLFTCKTHRKEREAVTGYNVLGPLFSLFICIFNQLNIELVKFFATFEGFGGKGFYNRQRAGKTKGRGSSPVS